MESALGSVIREGWDRLQAQEEDPLFNNRLSLHGLFQLLRSQQLQASRLVMIT